MHTSTIQINETDIKLTNILNRGAKAPIEQRIAAQVLIEDQIKKLKATNDILEELNRSNSYANVVTDMANRGTILRGSKPVIQVTTRLGDTIRIFINGGIDEGFEISPDLSHDKVPDRYTKTNILLNRKVIEADFNAGTLPTELQKYCSKNPVEVLKIKTFTSKGGK